MKKIDTEFYKSTKDDFVKHIKNRNVKKWDELNPEISLYCACTGLPVIIAIDYCLQEFPEFEAELEKKKKVVKEFYGYET